MHGQTTDQKTKRPRGIDFSVGDCGTLLGWSCVRQEKKLKRAQDKTIVPIYSRLKLNGSALIRE